MEWIFEKSEFVSSLLVMPVITLNTSTDSTGWKENP